MGTCAPNLANLIAGKDVLRGGNWSEQTEYVWACVALTVSPCGEREWILLDNHLAQLQFFFHPALGALPGACLDESRL